jgi:DNA-damage-inducible protein D
MSQVPADPESTRSAFEAARQTTPAGEEYWSARDLADLLDYADYRNFLRVVDKARIACANSGQPPADHFVDTTEMVTIGSGAQRKIDDIHLSRYACYLIIQNADPDKEVVALGQTYFAVRTRHDELTVEDQAALTEARRRLMLRKQISAHHQELSQTARAAGIQSGQDFAIFMDHGYRGLYGGLGARDIHRRKGLRGSDAILDHMGSEELAANMFRITQAEAKIRHEGIQGKEAANQTHQDIGREVRDTIARIGGTMPENLPTPPESIQQLEAADRKRAKQGPQLSMFPDVEADEPESGDPEP